MPAKPIKRGPVGPPTRSSGRQEILTPDGRVIDSVPKKTKGRKSLFSRREGSSSTGGSGGSASKKPSKSATGLDPSLETVDASSPWFIDERKFPRYEPIASKLRFCLKYAVLAPSSHNSQPWKFHIDATGGEGVAGCVEVFADRMRALPVADPHDRELTISVGCAVGHLTAGLRRFGLGERVALMPDAERPDLLASVFAEPVQRELSVKDSLMFAGMLKRRTVRHAFEARPVPERLTAELIEIAKGHGVQCAMVAGARPRQMLGKLVAEADEVQLASRAFRRELALWMHHNRSKAHDGIPGYAMGMNELMSLVAPLVVRTFDVGHGRAAQDEQLVEHSPLLLILGTENDTPSAWVRTGITLSHMLLRAAAESVGASYLNQPIEVEELRPRVGKIMAGIDHAQIVLRLGFGPAVAHTPRRKLEEVMMQAELPKPKRK